MIRNAVVNKDGTLNTKLLKSLWGKEIIVSVRKEKVKSDRKKSRAKSNWDETSEVFEKADKFDFPRKRMNRFSENSERRKSETRIC